jgi:hypothetical protein
MGALGRAASGGDCARAINAMVAAKKTEKEIRPQRRRSEL